MNKIKITFTNNAVRYIQQTAQSWKLTEKATEATEFKSNSLALICLGYALFDLSLMSETSSENEIKSITILNN